MSLYCFHDHRLLNVIQSLIASISLKEFSTYLQQVGRPYLWCQWMAGLQFLTQNSDEQQENTNEDDSDSAGLTNGTGCGNSAARFSATAVRARHQVSSAHMQRTVTLLRERIRARIALLHQLASLGEPFLSFLFM